MPFSTCLRRCWNWVFKRRKRKKRLKIVDPVPEDSRVIIPIAASAVWYDYYPDCIPILSESEPEPEMELFKRLPIPQGTIGNIYPEVIPGLKPDAFLAELLEEDGPDLNGFRVDLYPASGLAQGEELSIKVKSNAAFNFKVNLEVGDKSATQTERS